MTQLSGTSTGPNPLPTRRIRPGVMLIIMILPLLIVVVLGFALLESNKTQISSGMAPDFNIKTYDGPMFKLSAQKGKVVVVNFWASWCGPCRTEEPELNAIWDEYKDRGVIIIGLDWNDTESAARAFAQEFGTAYPIGNDDGGLAGRDYNVKGVPETYVIDKNGNIARTFLSAIDVKELRTVLDALIAQ